jgi:diguanylate cyclase (GGDEF)-like protein
MPFVIGCIIAAHDLWQLAVALVIRAIGALTTRRMRARARAARGDVKWAWVATGGLAFGCGAWVTHFVAMLADEPNHPMEFNLDLTLLSVLAAVLGGCLALAAAAAAGRRVMLAEIDPLTGLSNRPRLEDRLRQALAEASRSDGSVAVLCLDLDRFKAVNDFMGHQAGDSLLVEVANRLRAAARESDSVARLGGDGFILVWPFDGDQAAVGSFASRLVDVLSAPYMIDGVKVEISASIGIALYPSGATTAERLLSQADLALGRAKQDGRRRHRFFEPAMDTKLREYRTMEHDLRQALTRGELYLDYQPVFNGVGLELAGYEALARWRHPRLGTVSPAVFIPIAEECGAILPLGRWVLETACAEAASWSKPLGIAVNLSPAQFNNLDLPDEIADILARTGLPAARLELEVTEGVLIGDTDRAHAVLSAIQAQGVRIALDDFGTGYASLSYLRRFRFNRLKIDRSFIKEIGVDADAEAIVCAIMAMSKRLRLAVTAEGIETEQQLTLLRVLRCDHLQGFLLGRPGQVPAHSRSRDLAIATA